MKSLIFLCIFVAVVKAKNEDKDKWNDYKKEFNISFETDLNEKDAFDRFTETEKEINDHNKDPNNSWKMSMNKFSHLDYESFAETYCGTRAPINDLLNEEVSLAVDTTTEPPTTSTTQPPSTTTTRPYVYPFGDYTEATAPSEVDFRYLVQPVQNQKSCGSCWAFASMAQAGLNDFSLKIPFNIYLLL